MLRHVILSVAFSLAFGFSVQAQSLKLDSQENLSQSRRWTVLRNGGWVRVDGGRLEFFSPDGQRKRRLNLRGNEYLFAAPVSNVLGVIAFADRQPKTLSAVTFDLFADDGEQILRIDKPPFASVIVSPTGSAFVGVDGALGLPTSILRFYDRSGRRHDTVTVARYRGGEFCRDGSLVFVVSSETGLIAYAPTGRVVHDFGSVDHWAASDDGSVVMLHRQGRLYFFHNGGLSKTLGWRTDVEPIRHLAVSPNGLHAAVVSADHAAVIQVSSADVIWETEPGDPEWNFRTVDLTDDATFVVTGLDYDPGPSSSDRHTRSRCLVFDRTGKLIDSKNDAVTKWNETYPRVHIDQREGRLFFVNRDRFQTFRIEDLN
ncbi:MAG: hypothetical protein Kow0074_08940 [Candidatus Zixiibacteriota bacterium]